MGKYNVKALDDYVHNYSLVTTSFYNLPYTKRFPYELIMTGFNKDIFVHEDSFNCDEDYVQNELMEQLSDEGENSLLDRSVTDQHLHNFWLSLNSNTEAGNLYGTAWSGDALYVPSREILKKHKCAIIGNGHLTKSKA